MSDTIIKISHDQVEVQVNGQSVMVDIETRQSVPPVATAILTNRKAIRRAITTYTVASSSEPAVKHRITEVAGVAVACTCKGYRFYGYCKHVTC